MYKGVWVTHEILSVKVPVWGEVQRIQIVECLFYALSSFVTTMIVVGGQDIYAAFFQVSCQLPGGAKLGIATEVTVRKGCFEVGKT